MVANLDDIRRLRDRLKTWLIDAAYPIWWEAGADQTHGGFFETLDQAGVPRGEPKRARLQPRQMVAFATAPSLGWVGSAPAAVEHALAFHLTGYRRDDGLVRALAAADGTALDEAVVLYDQAFALLGYAAAHRLLGGKRFVDLAATLRTALLTGWRMPAGGFRSTLARANPLLSNPHMHLFEACLAWCEAGGDAGWRALADEIGDLALSRFILPGGGLGESFTEDWSPTPGVEGAVIEPGHQFEWAWLLMRWARLAGRPDATARGLALIDIGERLGVDPERGVATAKVLPREDALSGETLDGVARLWPQTERIKAAALAAEVTGDEAYWTSAKEASEALLGYFNTPTLGLWRDRMDLAGDFVDEPAPASSFYHIVVAVAELDRVLRALD